MHRRQLNFIGQLKSDESGAISIAELLVVLVVSSILFVALLNGQEFVSRLSQKFFDNAGLEAESRILLLRIEEDLSHTEMLLRSSEDRWILVQWDRDSVEYALDDSVLYRNREALLKKGAQPERFELSIGSASLQTQESWEPEERSNPVEKRPTTIHISFTLSHKGKSLDIDTAYNLRKRAPGT